MAAPIELRREGRGLSGALTCFLALPAGPDDLAFGLHWGQGEGLVAGVVVPQCMAKPRAAAASPAAMEISSSARHAASVELVDRQPQAGVPAG